MLDTVDFNHVQHISFTQSLLTDAVSVILSELLSYEHPPKVPEDILLYDTAADERCSPLRVRDFLYNAAVGAAIGRPPVKIRSDVTQNASAK